MRHVYDYIKQHKWLLWILIPAFFFHMLIIFPSGSYLCLNGNCGLYFWGVHGHDAVWHLAIVGVSFSQIPFVVPTYAGGLLSGYNILLDVIIWSLSKIGISPLVSFFKLLPVLWFGLFVGTAITLGRKLKDTPVFIFFLLFFLFFSGSFSYLLTLYHGSTIFGSSHSLVMQSGKMLTNLQLAFSFVCILGILIILKANNFTWRNTLILTWLVVLSIGFKFYGGVIALFLAGLYFLNALLFKKSFTEVLKHGIIMSFITLIAIIALYNPFASFESGSTFTYAPLAIAHSLIEEKDLFYMKDLVNAKYFLLESGRFSPRLVAIEIFTLTLFLVFNFGTRILGLFYFVYKLITRKASRFEVYLFLATLFATCLTLFFVQKGVWWNTVQFLYYGLFLANIFLAEFVYVLWQRKNVFLRGLVIIIILLNIPQNIDSIKDFSSLSAAYISKSELEAMNFLKSQPQGIITHSFEKDYTQPYSFYNYEETSYIPAFTGKQVYIGNVVQLDLVGVDYKERIKAARNKDCNQLKSVDYIYYVKAHKDEYLTGCRQLVHNSFERIFENDEVIVFGR